jgi:sarcosine/dimethylglycine N-methyltransferase
MASLGGKSKMSRRENVESVVQFFDTHPINEQQILHDLKRDGIELDGLSEDILQNYDQDHFGGLEAVDLLARKAGIDASTHVLDVCSGLGGPARYLAKRLGCRVTGIDITRSRHESAVRLTEMVGLDQLVDFQHCNALDMPFSDASFDVVISEEAFAHVPEKPRLIAECARVVKPGGTIAFTDVLRKERLQASALARLQGEMAAAKLGSLAEYRDLLAGAGCTVVSCEDLSAPWTEILVKRLEMYRSLRDTTVAKFGEAHFRKWDDTYAFFVGLFVDGQLGGGRFVAVRNA